MKILNLTQHVGTPEQAADGLVDLGSADIGMLRALLTFDDPPSSSEIIARAEAIADIAVNHGYQAAMIGGALWLMSALEMSLKLRGIKPVYSFSRRVVVEEAGQNGEVVKTTKFKHERFIHA